MEKIFKWSALFIVLIILAAGGVAFYTVFLADRGMTVPSFREMLLIDAVADAEQLGLSVRVEQMESNLPMGRVLAQWPEPGDKLRGSDRNIILKVSRGGERRPMPDVRGVDQTRATMILENQGFAVGDIIRVKDSSNSGIPAGAVIAQSPASPASVPVTAMVDLLVNEGSEDGRFAMPNVSNEFPSSAREILESAGLRVASVEDEKVRNRNVIKGQVAYSRPAAGSMVRRGDAVRLFLSIGEGTVTASIPGRGAVRTTEPNLTDVSVLDNRGGGQVNVRPEPIPRRQPQNDPHSPEFNLPQGRAATQPTAPSRTAAPAATAPQETTSPPPVVPSAPAPVAGSKIARVRYQVPPLLRPLPLRIEITDPQGTRVLLERNARPNETVQVDGSYTQEAVVSISLGGEFVWQETFR